MNRGLRSTQPILLDVTRLADRMLKGRLPTGVDRVGLAYLQHFGERALAVVRFAGRWIILNPAGTHRLFNALSGHDPQAAVAIRASVGSGYALSWRKWHGALFFNTGHSGLCHLGYAGELIKRGFVPVFFLHDLIPVTHPEYCRPGEADKHHRRLRTMLEAGQGMIMSSASTRDELLAYANLHGYAMPPHQIIPLAPTHLPAPDRVRLLDKPYFVVLGTIEPRKNHLLLLNVWRELVQSLGDSAPALIIIGQRGWECEQVVDMLDRCPALTGTVVEKTACDDRELSTWLYHAQALLFPSFVEGFGIPLIESLMLGVPVIASDLPVFHEIAGDIPEYLDPLDGLGWKQMILAYGQTLGQPAQAQRNRMIHYTPPTWEQHFVQVEALLASLPGNGK